MPKQQIFLHFGEDDFPLAKSFQKALQDRVFSVWASRSGFGAAISVAVVRHSV